MAMYLYLKPNIPHDYDTTSSTNIRAHIKKQYFYNQKSTKQQFFLLTPRVYIFLLNYSSAFVSRTHAILINIFEYIIKNLQQTLFD